MPYIDKININGSDRDLRDVGAIRFDEIQNLTDEQKVQSRMNIGSTAYEYALPLVNTAGPSSIVTIDDGADNAPMRHLIVGIEPAQDLHGYDNPWPAGGGKNLFNESNAIVEYDSNRYCKLENGLLHYKNDGSLFCYSKEFDINLPSGSYTLSLSNYRLVSGTAPLWMVKIGSDPLVYPSTGTAYTFTLAEPNTVKIRLTTSGTTTATEFYGNVQLEKGSTATAYAPYSNICPITGWTGTNVTLTGKNLFNDTWFQNNGGVKQEDGSWYIQNLAYVSARTVVWKNPGYTGQFALRLKHKTINESGSGGGRFIWKYKDGSNVTIYINNSTDYIEVTNISDGNKIVEALLWDYGSSINSTWFKEVQLEVGATISTYEPFGTIYPISWQSEAGTVYGGTLDVVTGVLTVDRALHTVSESDAYGLQQQGTNGYRIGICLPNGKLLADSAERTSIVTNTHTPDTHVLVKETWKVGQCLFYNWNTGPTLIALFIVPNQYANHARAYLASIGTSILYKLATPQTYQLTPTMVKSLIGTNHVWADTGDTTIEYQIDLRNYIESKLPVTVLSPSGNTHTLLPCPVTYNFGEKSELTVTVTATSQYHFMFSCPSGTPTVLTMTGITGRSGDTLAAGKTYEVDIWAGIALIKELEVTAV